MAQDRQPRPEPKEALRVRVLLAVAVALGACAGVPPPSAHVERLVRLARSGLPLDYPPRDEETTAARRWVDDAAIRALVSEATSKRNPPEMRQRIVRELARLGYYLANPNAYDAIDYQITDARIVDGLVEVVAKLTKEDPKPLWEGAWSALLVAHPTLLHKHAEELARLLVLHGAWRPVLDEAAVTVAARARAHAAVPFLRAYGSSIGLPSLPTANVMLALAALGDTCREDWYLGFYLAHDVRDRSLQVWRLSAIGTRRALSVLAADLRVSLPLVDGHPGALRELIVDALRDNYPDEPLFRHRIASEADYDRVEAFVARELGIVFTGPRPPAFYDVHGPVADTSTPFQSPRCP